MAVSSVGNCQWVRVIYLLIQFMVVKNHIYVDVILIRMSSLILIPDFVNQTVNFDVIIPHKTSICLLWWGLSFISHHRELCVQLLHHDNTTFRISNVLLSHKLNFSILIVANEDYSRNASSFVYMVTPWKYYSQTCLMWSSKGTFKYGHIKQVVA
jgi:hypothetical protein